MVYKLLLNLIDLLLLYSEFISHWFAFSGTFEQFILYWVHITLICLLWHIRAVHIVLIYLLWHIRRIRQQTVRSNAWTFTYGSSPVVIWGSQVQPLCLEAWNDVKSHSDAQVISAILYFICLRFMLGWSVLGNL